MLAIWCHAKVFQLAIHLIHDFVSLLAAHVVEVQVLLAHCLVLPLEEGPSRHVHKSAAEEVLRLLLWLPKVVVILLDGVWRISLFLELFGAQRCIGTQAREGLPTVVGDARSGEAPVTLLYVSEGQGLHVVVVVKEIHGCLVDLVRVSGHLLVEDAGPDQGI